MSSLTALKISYCAFVVLAAYAVRGAAGFGSGVVAIPLLALALPMQIIVPVITLLGFTASIGHGVKARRMIVWHELLKLFPFTVLGVLAGLVATLFGGMAGPIYVIYLDLMRLAKGQLRVTIATILLVLAGMRLAGYFGIGFFNRETMLVFAAALPMMLIGMYIGEHVHAGMSQQTFVRIVAAILVVSGAALILK